jgi:hypothetical protein
VAAVTWLDRVTGWVYRVADVLLDREDEQQRRAIELVQQRTAVLTMRHEARDRQRDIDRGILVPRRPEP